MRKNLQLFVAASLVCMLTAPARAAVVCQGPNTVEGVDVSRYQGSIDWNAVKASGKVFGIASVGDGTYQDPTFDTNWNGMKAAGLIRGAYQFFEPADDPTVLANILIGKVGQLGNGDLPATLDVEATGGQSAATIVAHIHTWVDAVTAGTGKKPIIYTGKYFWNDNVGTADFAGLPLWIAAYGVNCPDTPDAWGGWQFWQYADNGPVGGIGNCDVDRFNGSLADLQVFAGGADWSAQFVGQSFPYASTAITLTVGEELPAYIELRNTGNQTWDANTRLGTSNPRDRASPFAAANWLSPSRASQVSGTVAPGASYKFAFTFHAPSKPGTYHEFFNLVQEGVHWFSDAGQGGPVDDQLEAQIVVVEAPFHAEFVAQSFPPSQSGAVALGVGQTVDGWIDLKNVGTDTWKAGVTKLAPTPRDQASPLAAGSWLSPTRVSTLAMDVPPGATGRFAVTLAGTVEGDYSQTFGLVEESVTWFADAPKGGGLGDDFLRVRVVVGAGAANTGSGTTPGLGGVGGGGGGGGGSPEGAGGGMMPGAPQGNGVGFTCQMGATGATGATAATSGANAAGSFALLALGLALALRRRALRPALRFARSRRR